MKKAGIKKRWLTGTTPNQRQDRTDPGTRLEPDEKALRKLQQFFDRSSGKGRQWLSWFRLWSVQSIFVSQVGLMVMIVMMENAEVTGVFFLRIVVCLLGKHRLAPTVSGRFRLPSCIFTRGRA